MSKKTILILTANPTDTQQRLRMLDSLIDEIKSSLHGAKVEFVIEPHKATCPKDIRPLLLKFKPYIVQFCMHGMSGNDTAPAHIALEDELGKTARIRPETMENLFKLFSDHVKCVVLNACHSEDHATAVSRHIDYVIGMKSAIYDRSANAFARGFYHALGADEPIERAYQHGCNEIEIAGLPGTDVPILKTKTQKPDQTVIPETPVKTSEPQTPPDNSAIKIFIICADEDAETARRLYEDFKKKGLNPWLEHIDIQLGQSRDQMFRRVMEQSDFVLALLSKHSLKRGFAQKQLRKALDIFEEFPPGDIFLIPVQLDDTRPQDEILRSMRSAKLYESYPDGLKQILRAIQND